MKHRFFCLCLFPLAMLVAFGPAAAEQISNGSFELAQQSGPTRVSTTQIVDWVDDGAGFNLLEQGPNGVSFVGAQDGTQFVSFGHNGQTGSTLSQVFATDAGVVYTVSFWTRAIQVGNPADPQVLEATVSSGQFKGQSTLGTLQADVQSTDAWVQSTFTFAATGATATLAFSDIVGGSPDNIALDNVSVVAVPEPATAALTLAAAGLACTRRRRPVTG
ncbi:MAG: DUF642 domain-containing protein [Planctomycetota bacterium]